ncbi:aminotransferase class IV [Streptomyces sp. NPDC006610]|jgi:branched-subunit amino acid aminotransferase/4-amino-4-deoxychorismate lyase|uniref:aminotransferase class IV n=1 Tax=Streptomyces sp. NPDC006610 TaxID=3154584 RepID=UPI0033AE3FCA
MACTERWLAWDGERGFAPAADPAGDLLVADSWLVADGRVRAVERHGARFAASCVRAGLRQPAVRRFWDAAVAELPREGQWFPRVELHPDGTLALNLRRAPDLAPAVRVLPWPYADPRTAPLVKGPDIGRLAQVRARARAAGADEALFTTEDGRVTESTTASLLWWEGPDLCLPDAEDRVLPGVTSALLSGLARDRGVVVRRARAAFEDLYDRETWLVNALHGIRPVTEWISSGRRAAPAERAPRWQRLLRAQARHLDDSPIASEHAHRVP